MGKMRKQCCRSLPRKYSCGLLNRELPNGSAKESAKSKSSGLGKLITTDHARGRTSPLDRQTEPLVLSSEISGLDDLRGFLKYGNHVARFYPAMGMACFSP